MPMAIAWRTFSLSQYFFVLFMPTYMMFSAVRGNSLSSALALMVSKSSAPGLSMPSTVPDVSSTSRCAASVLQRMTASGVLGGSPQ